MDYLYQYLIFLAQAITIVVAIVAVLSAMAAMGARRISGDSGHLEVHKLNDSLNALRDSLRRALLDPSAFKKQQRQEAKAEKSSRKAAKKSAKQQSLPSPAGDSGGGEPSAHKEPSADEEPSADKEPSAVEEPSADKETSATAEPRRLFVLDFKGDLAAHAVKHLRTEITAILTMATPSDEVLLRLESPGGAVHGYGLAASQLDRLHQHGIRLVVAVDKVAASGGYMMAVVADRILAAPFALIGSIGVVAQVPNFHRLLKKHDVDVEVLTAGKYKRTLTVLGENTEEGRRKFIEELEDVHALFQEYVAGRRPDLDLDAVATGEAWYGQRALERQLIDEISTSDEYLTQACARGDVFHVRWVEHKKPIERLLGQIEGAIARTLQRITGNW